MYASSFELRVEVSDPSWSLDRLNWSKILSVLKINFTGLASEERKKKSLKK
jgi:hypothetical protein